MPRFPELTIGAACGAFLLAACGEATPPAPCTEGGTGDLVVTISGVPAGGTAEVRVTGPGGATTLSATQTLAGIATGSYTVTVTPVTVADSLVSTVFDAGGGTATVCVRDAESRSVTVVYSKVPTSGSLWYGAGFYSLGFSASQLVTTATLSPTTTVATRGGAGVTFDRAGNLWVRGQSASDPVLMRYPASALAATGSPLPDRTIGIAGLTCVDAGALAFDSSGNLWMSLGCQGRIVRLTPAQYAGSGTLSPTVQISGLTNPKGIAFDSLGNLWVADQTHLRRYDAARLAANITTAADLSVAFTTPTPAVPGATALGVFHLAFRPNGELWVSSVEQAALFRVEPAVTAATGAQTTLVTRIVYLNAFMQPKGFAFDNAGGLFIGTSQSTFARLSPAQLGVNSTPGAPTLPQRSIASASILGYGDDIAIFPAPPGTPLYHRAP
jgi:streptogramin lyase